MEKQIKLKTTRGREITSVESISLLSLKVGQSFYTVKKDKDITAIASHYSKKVKTERLFTMNPQSGKTKRIVMVTILKDTYIDLQEKLGKK